MGASAYELENTLKAFSKALEMGADAVEMDVRQTLDGKLVLLHDQDLKSVAGVDKRVAQLTLGELRSIRLKNGQTVPTLDEALDFIRGKAIVCLELKVPGVEGIVIDAIRDCGMESCTIIDSFYHNSIRNVNRLAPDILTGIDFEGLPVDFLRVVKSAEADLAYVSAESLNYFPETVEKFRAEGIGTVAWTVDLEEDLRKLLPMRLFGIITNKPDLMKACRDGMA